MKYHFPTDSLSYSLSDLLQNPMSASHTIKAQPKKFEINRTKIKGCCQLIRNVVPHDSKSDLPLAENK